MQIKELTLADNNTETTSLVLSYLGLRRAIGILALGLPFVLVVGKVLLQSQGIEPSISDYYYTVMGDVFVGTLCAIGVFLMSYRGYERVDDIAGNLACVFVVGVALFPTMPAHVQSHAQEIIGFVHYGFAAAFFLTLAYFCLALFCKTDPSKPMTRQKVWRNRVYTICGYLILLCIGLLAAYGQWLRGTAIDRLDPVFWLESVAVITFGLSWLVKGEALLSDDSET